MVPTSECWENPPTQRSRQLVFHAICTFVTDGSLVSSRRTAATHSGSSARVEVTTSSIR